MSWIGLPHGDEWILFAILVASTIGLPLWFFIAVQLGWTDN